MTETVARPVASTLEWGRRYLMVRPDHFRIEYQINPFMDLQRQPQPVRAQEQWSRLVEAIRAAGGEVEVLAQRADSPDMVYAMNLGLVVERPQGRGAVLSHMRYAERRNETASADEWFVDNGYTTSYLGQAGIGAHFEAGDAFPYAGRLLVGYWPRTERLALKHLAASLQVRVEGLRITHPGMYHLDLAFCPLDSERALVCPAAFDSASATRLIELVPDPIILTEDEAMTFVANSIVVGRTVIAPACPDRIRRHLDNAGFDVVIVDVDEFHKGGGSIRCLTNPLDITVGRDLDVVESGEVFIPRG